MRKVSSILGTLIHAAECGRIEILEDALIEASPSGSIADVLTPEDKAYTDRLASAREQKGFLELEDGQYLLPGMIDLHIHAPQWPQLGKALHLPLEQWLQKHTFPLEAKYADLQFAETSYRSLVSTLLANGTTTAVYFGTIHLEATQLLADICLDLGQRAYVGKVAMDNPDQCPEFYRDAGTQKSLEETRAFIDYVRSLNQRGGDLIHPVVTPRFIPSCTDDMLRGLSAIAQEFGCHVQTHCSESDWQHQYVLDRHGKRDTASLDAFGLLTDKTILAHCTLADKGDMALMRKRHASVAHCPLSNYYFSNAVFPARMALDEGVNVGLGTDIAGGPSPSLLNNIAVAVTSSRALEEGVDPSLDGAMRGSSGARIDFREAFWMATAGGAAALDLKAGRFEPGYCFDAFIVDIKSAHSNIVGWPSLDGPEDILQKIIYGAAPDNVTAVWVQGRQVR